MREQVGRSGVRKQEASRTLQAESKEEPPMEPEKQGGDVTVQEGVRTASLPQKGAAAEEAEPGVQFNRHFGRP